MKQPQILPIDAAIDALDRFDVILDARSESEYADDHIPGAISTPVLDDAQRAEVGTLHKQKSAFEAARVGAALVARNIAGILERQAADWPRDIQPLVYCWRGGNRSGALATVLARVGWRTTVIEGGYREFRRRVLRDLETLPARFSFVVVAGRTGSAKSRILEAIEARGEQVLDLERIGRHRGSVLGAWPDAPQPPQKLFETAIWNALRRFDPSRPVFVESESKKVGSRHVPDALMLAIRASRCVRIESPRPQRARFLVEDYEHFVKDRDALFAKLDLLVELHGRERIAGWRALADAGDWTAFVDALLADHYDPAYDRSMRRNYARISLSPKVELDGIDPGAIDRAARAVIDAADGGPEGSDMIEPEPGGHDAPPVCTIAEAVAAGHRPGMPSADAADPPAASFSRPVSGPAA